MSFLWQSGNSEIRAGQMGSQVILICMFSCSSRQGLLSRTLDFMKSQFQILILLLPSCQPLGSHSIYQNPFFLNVCLSFETGFYFLAQADLALNPPASGFQILKLQTHATKPNLKMFSMVGIKLSSLHIHTRQTILF